MEFWMLVSLFFFIALLYGSVGFGGGSSYIALLVLYEMPQEELRFMALLCNLAVVTGSTYLFYKAGHLVFQKIWPILLLSVPMAFIGGYIRLDKEVFMLFLGICLIAAAKLMWMKQTEKEDHTVTPSRPRDMLLGGSIGFLSGMVGIGGGIFLAPILHLIQWARAKEIAATAAAFILFNSLSGLSGQLYREIPQLSLDFFLPLLGAVSIGGQIGVRLSILGLRPIFIKRLTALLVLYVGARILWKLLC